MRGGQKEIWGSTRLEVKVDGIEVPLLWHDTPTWPQLKPAPQHHGLREPKTR